MITRAFPPKGGGGVQRIVKFTEFLPDLGWAPLVLAPAVEEARSWVDHSLSDCVDSANVYRVPMANSRTPLQKVMRRLYPVDAFRGWAHAVSRRGLNLNLRPDIVFSSGPPHSVHLAGAKLSKHFACGWVADFRDHFTLGPEYRPVTRLHRIMDRSLEQKVLSTADAVICNTRTNREELLDCFGRKFESKVHVIYNGFDRSDLMQAGQSQSLMWNEVGVRNYLYLGGLRGPKIDDVFFKAIDLVSRNLSFASPGFVVRVVGDSTRGAGLVRRLVEDGIVSLSDPVPAGRIGPVIAAADGCLTWQGNRRQYRGTVAGKVFDYIAMEKPIFSIGQPDGEVAGMLNKYDCGVTAAPSQTPEEIAAKFLDFHHRVENGSFRLHFDETVEQYSRQYQANQLAKVLSNLCKRKARAGQ